MTNNNNFKRKNNKKRVNFKKPCVLCQRGVNHIDYKDVDLLQKYITSNCKIAPTRITGCCQKHQRMVANAIKRARIVALLPFVNEYK